MNLLLWKHQKIGKNASQNNLIITNPNLRIRWQMRSHVCWWCCGVKHNLRRYSCFVTLLPLSIHSVAGSTVAGASQTLPQKPATTNPRKQKSWWSCTRFRLHGGGRALLLLCNSWHTHTPPCNKREFLLKRKPSSISEGKSEKNTPRKGSAFKARTTVSRATHRAAPAITTTRVEHQQNMNYIQIMWNFNEQINLNFWDACPGAHGPFGGREINRIAPSLAESESRGVRLGCTSGFLFCHFGFFYQDRCLFAVQFWLRFCSSYEDENLFEHWLLVLSFGSLLNAQLPLKQTRNKKLSLFARLLGCSALTRSRSTFDFKEKNPQNCKRQSKITLWSLPFAGFPDGVR